jgi:hypothetical protein
MLIWGGILRLTRINTASTHAVERRFLWRIWANVVIHKGVDLPMCLDFCNFVSERVNNASCRGGSCAENRQGNRGVFYPVPNVVYFEDLPLGGNAA